MRNDATPHNTEDRGWWYLHGEKLEQEFVRICNERLNLVAFINPEKLINKTVPDLIVEGRLSDLKTQNTPFFTSGRYGIPPQYCVTFNRKDYHHYKQKYSEIDIYFWIEWTQLRYRMHLVPYMAGIYRIPFAQLAKMIENGVPEHKYLNRQDPLNRNAKSSFILDVRNMENLFLAT